MMHHLKEENVLLIMTQNYPSILILTEIIHKRLPPCVELVCDKNESKE